MSKARKRIAIVGAGPGGLAMAIAAIRAGFDVTLYERYKELRPVGSILNLWPPPHKVLRLLGVDIPMAGLATQQSFENNRGKVRAVVHLPPEVLKELGGIIGFVRPGLYQAMLRALPDGVIRLGHEFIGFQDLGDRVVLNFANQKSAEADVLIGADGIRSVVRRQLWGDSPIRDQRLVTIGAYMFTPGEEPTDAVIAFDRTRQVSYMPVVYNNKSGYQWWTMEPAGEPVPSAPAGLHRRATKAAAGFGAKVRDIIAKTPPEHLQSWEIMDREPIKQWSKGRVTIIGDAAHPTSPYAGHGAGMAIEDGYFLASALERADMSEDVSVRGALQAFEDKRRPHTAAVSQHAFYAGYMAHHLPRILRPLRDLVYDHTPLMRKYVGEAMPAHIMSALAEIDEVERSRPQRPASTDRNSSTPRSAESPGHTAAARAAGS